MVQTQAGSDTAAKPSEKPASTDGKLKGPVLIYSVAPEFSDEARNKKVNGNVRVFLTINEKGNPSDVKVVKGLGLGLDYKAVEAVRQYKFKPATRDGVPVKVDMYIDVNFQLF